MNGSIIVLNITSEEVKFAEIVEEDGGKATIRRLSHFKSAKESPVHTTEAIRKLIEADAPRNRRAFLVINSQDLDYKDFSFPFGSPKKVSGAIRFEISSEYPSDEYVVDHIESISRESGKKSFLAAIAKRALLRERIKDVEDAGLQVAGITCDLSTLGNYFIEENQALVMEMGQRQTLFALYSNGVPVLMRDIPIGIRDIDNSSEKVKDAELKPLIGEIRRTIHSFSARTGFGLDKIYASGNMVAHRNLMTALNEMLEFRFIDQPPVAERFKVEGQGNDLNLYASVLGMAGLKKRPKSLDLLKDDLVKTHPALVGRTYLKWGSAILVSFLIAMLFSSWLKIVVLQKREKYLGTEIKKTFATTFPQVKRTVDEVKQARNLLESKRSERGGGDSSSSASILDVIETMSRTIPKETSFQVVNFFWEKGRIEIDGKTDSFKNVNVIQELLSKSQHFPEVSISNARSKEGGQDVEFKITLRMAG